MPVAVFILRALAGRGHDEERQSKRDMLDLFKQQPFAPVASARMKKRVAMSFESASAHACPISLPVSHDRSPGSPRAPFATSSTTNGLPEHPLSRRDTIQNENSANLALNTMKNDANGATRRSSPQVYLDHNTMSGNSRVLVRMSASDEWMAASLQNNASDISTHADLAYRSGRFPNASLPIHLSAELTAGNQPNIVAPFVSSEHLKALPECTGPDIHKIVSSMAGINISRTSLSNQRAATDASSNSSDVSAPLRQSDVSRTEKSPAKHHVQLPILSSYADATNFAARFPELASEVLSRPLKTVPISGFANVGQSALETGHPKMPEHTADRPNWALAPEVMVDSNDSTSIAPDEMDVDATSDVCSSDCRRAKVSVRTPVVSNGFDPESPEQSRNKRRLLRSAPCRRTHVKAANSHNRFGGMRGFGDNTQENSTDYSSHSASSPVDWTPNTSRHSLLEASDSSKHPGRKEDRPTSCHAWDIVDDRSPRPKSDDEWENPSGEASWDSTGERVEFPNSQQAPQIDSWSRPVAQVSWEYPSSEPPKMPQSPQGFPYHSPEPAQQSPIEPVLSSSAKQLQAHPFVGWMSPSDIRGGIASQHHAKPPRSLHPRPQFDGANEWHTSLPLRRILPGDVGHASSSTVVDSRLNDISIPTSPLTTPSARKTFVREAIIKAEQPSKSPADIIKTRIFTQSVPLSPRPVLFRADSWNSTAPYTTLGTNRGEGDTAEKEPPVWNTAQTEVPEVTPITIDSNLPMKSVGHSKQLDAVVTLVPSPTPALGDSVYQSGKPGASATIPTAGTLERVLESEVEPSVDGTGCFHILKPKEQTIHSCPVASQSDLTPSKKRQLPSDSVDQSKVSLNASRDPERPFAMWEVPAYPSAAETPGEGKGVVDNSLLSQDEIFLEDPEAHCFSDTKASSAPECSSETQVDGPEEHLDGYAWRMGRPVSGWRRGLLDQSLSQKYIPPPARRFPPSTFSEKPGLPFSEQTKIYTFKLPPIPPVPRSSSQDVKTAPEAQVKQSVSKVKWEAPQHTNATSAGHNNTFTTDVSAPEIIKLTELGRSSSDVHAPLSLRVVSPLCNINNADTDLAPTNCFEPSKSPLMSFSETNCTPLEHRAISALPSDQVETPDLASQNSSSLLIASRSMGKENMSDVIPSSPTPWFNNQMLSAPHPSLNVVGALQWPPRVGIASSIQEHILTRQDSIAVTDYLHHPSQSPSRSSNPDIYSAQNQLPTAFVHDSTFAPIQGYHCEMPSVQSELYHHPPVQSYFHPELTQDLVGTSGWIIYPNFDGDAQDLINERGAIDNTALAPQSHSRPGHLPRSEHPLVNTSPSQRSGSMPQISSRPSVLSGFASRTQYPAEQEASFLSSGRQFVSPRYPVASSAHSLSSYAGEYDMASQTYQRECSTANSHPLHVRQNGQGYSSQDF